MTMDITNTATRQQTLSKSHRENVKLSPDSVCEPNVRTSIHSLVRKGHSSSPSPPDDGSHCNNLNVPPLLTPLKPKSIKSTSSSLSDDEAMPFPTLPPTTQSSTMLSRTNMPPKLNRRLRSSSEGDACSNGSRRTLFGQYWNNEQRKSISTGLFPSNVGGSRVDDFHLSTAPNDFMGNHLPPPKNRIRKRSSSMTVIDFQNQHLSEPKDYRMYGPPKEFAIHSPICGRFTSVGDVPKSSYLESLPPLPAPLRRLCSNGHEPGTSGGMYPLVTPVSILRPSSHRGELQENGTNHEDSSQQQQQQQQQAMKVPCHHQDGESSLDGVSTCSSDTSSQRSAVRFDPRVTVTEYEDQVERVWYNDSELDRLKKETLRVAQLYFMTHTEQAEQFIQEKLDPVTGTYRRKALYAMPVLAEIDDDDTFSASHEASYQELLKHHVSSILLVDPNVAILDLFQKSMHSMFPNAQIDKTQSGEEALHMVSKKLQESENSEFPNRHYDIIIVEQRLNLPTRRRFHDHHQNNGLLTSSSVSMPALVEQDIPDPIPFSATMQKPSSFSGTTVQTPSNGMLGAEVISRIRALEEQKATKSSESGNEETNSTTASSTTTTKSTSPSSTSMTPEWASLLIGVSMQPQRDAKLLRGASADVVWGKPIPRVGDSLRSQLLRELVTKRRGPSANELL